MNAGVLRCAQNDISIFAFILFFTLLLFRALSTYTQSVSRGPGREGASERRYPSPRSVRQRGDPLRR
jgi:hypothetical protein